MKTIRTQTEKYLGEIMASLRDTKMSWRAQVYSFSQLKEFNQAKELEKILQGFTTDRFVEQEGFVFLCSDDDVIVLGKGITQKSFDDLATDFVRQAFASGVPYPVATWVKIYDLGVHWPEFIALCDAKHAAAEAAKAVPALVKPVVEKNPLLDLPEDAVHRLLQKGLEERQNRKRPCVLLVEDDPVSLHLARRALDGAFTITSATNAVEARAAYIDRMPDVVFLDIGLPDASGHDLIKEFISIDPEAYLVMLSGNSFQDDILKAMRRGAKGFVGKPFSRAKLLHYVAQSPHCHFQIPIHTIV